MVSHFDENDLFVSGRSFEDDLVLMIHREYDETIVGKMTLKGLEFGQSARTFGHASNAMQFFGFSFLDGVASLKISVVWVSTTPPSIRQSLHGDDGTGAAQFVLVLDFHDTLFDIQQFLERHTAFADPLVPSPSSRISNVRDVKGERIVQSELFVGVQHARNLLHDFSSSEIIVYPFTDSHPTGMIRVSQPIGIDVDEKMIVGLDFWIVEDLLAYGALERFFHLTR